MELKVFDEYADDLRSFQEWIETQPSLPKNLNKLLLLRYLKVNDFDQEAAQKLLYINLMLRKKHSDVFTDRDIQSSEIETAISAVRMTTLVSHTAENYKITIISIVDNDISKFDPMNALKVFGMMTDIRFITPDPDRLTEGEVIILDFAKFGFRYFMKATAGFSYLCLFIKYVQEAVPFIIREIHMVNCSYIVSKLLALVRPFIKRELFDVINLHTAGYDMLHEFISKDLLPTEYGGNAGSEEDIFNDWLEIVKSHTEYLKDDTNWELLER